MAHPLDAYLEDLVRLGILGAADSRALRSGPIASGEITDHLGLIAMLVRNGQLTTHQATTLREGKADELVLGNYVIQEKLGAGGMGAVFKARHKRMKRTVAIKLLRTTPGKDSIEFDRFQREVEAVAKLEHPNVVMAYDADEAQFGPFLVMEYVDGSDLDSIVKRGGPMPVDAAVDALIQAARGLAYAHSKGVVHRDIKPANLMRDQNGTIKVADLGLARLVGEASNTADEGLTQSGTIFGTVDYMSPEQGFESREADHRSDLYSMGCTLYFLLTGGPVFPGHSMVARLIAHREHAVPSLRAKRPDVPEALDQVYQQLLAKRPEDRISSMEQLIQRLEACAPAAAPARNAIVPASASFLLVEQSRSQAMLMASLLRKTGATEVCTCTDGKSALETARRGPIDVVISSKYLPDMTGLELLLSLRREAALQNLVFILVSSDDDPATTEALLRARRAAALPKPFSAEQLHRAVAEAATR